MGTHKGSPEHERQLSLFFEVQTYGFFLFYDLER